VTWQLSNAKTELCGAKPLSNYVKRSPRKEMRESSCLISRKCDAIESSALGMLGFLQRWAYDHDIRLKLFNPTKSVQDRLEHAGSVPEFDIATLDEMMALLARADSRYALAA